MAVDPPRIHRAGDPASAVRFRFRVTWNCASTARPAAIRPAIIRAPGSSSARPAISTPPATCTPCSDACWRGSSTRCGACSGRRRGLIWWNSGPAADCSRRTCWTGRQRSFPSFTARSIRRWWKPRRGLRARLEERFCCADRGGQGAGGGNGSSSAKIEGEFIVFANEFFDALPVEVVADRGELRIGAENGRFVESFAPPSAAELEFLDRYSVHPEAGERVEAALVALDHLRRIAPRRRRTRAVSACWSITATRARSSLAGRHRDTVMALSPAHHVARTRTKLPASRTSRRT